MIGRLFPSKFRLGTHIRIHAYTFHKFCLLLLSWISSPAFISYDGTESVSRVYNPLLLQRFDFLCEGFNLLFECLIFPAALCAKMPQRVAPIARIAKGIPMQAMMMLFCLSNSFRCHQKRSLTFTLRFLTSVVSTARSVFRVAMSSLISEFSGVWARKGIATIQNRIERNKIVFMGNFHVITHLTLARWVADPYQEIGLARLPT